MESLPPRGSDTRQAAYEKLKVNYQDYDTVITLMNAVPRLTPDGVAIIVIQATAGAMGNGEDLQCNNI